MSFTPPYPAVFYDCYVGPVESLTLTRFSFEASGCDLAHTRADFGNPSATSHQSEMTDSSNCETVDGPAIYAGPLYPHFGHFLAESIHRLYALSAFPELRNAPIFYHGVVRYNFMQWMYDVFAHLGIPKSQVRLVDRPLHFRELHVPKQARGLGTLDLIEGYARNWPTLPTAPPRNRMVYLSRTKMGNAGGILLGEKVIEDTLRAAGFDIVFPEDIGVEGTVAMLRESSHVVFAEGSSIHNAEVAGRQEASAFMIARRPLSERRFDGVLQSYFERYKIYAAFEHFFSFDFVSSRISGKGAALIDIKKVISEIADFCHVDIPEPADDIIRAGVRKDIADFFKNPNVIVGNPPPEKLTERAFDILTNARISSVLGVK